MSILRFEIRYFKSEHIRRAWTPF